MAALLHTSQGGDAFQQQYCDATVIAPDWVLTAAHCAQGEDPAQLAVFLGQVDLTQPGTTIPVARLVINPTYDPRHTANDAALVQLRHAIPDDVYAPIALVGAGDTSRAAPGSPVRVAGWGATKAKVPYAYPSGLRQADIQIQPDAVCGRRKAYGKTFRAASMLCAGNDQQPVKDACYGDSGGPLFADSADGPVEVGVVSWGRSCAQLGYPGIYTRLSDPAIADWIQNVLTGS
jgi:trypsin